MLNFFREAVKDQVKVDPSNPAHDMATHIRDIANDVDTIRLFVLTDGTTTITDLKDSKTDANMAKKLLQEYSVEMLDRHKSLASIKIVPRFSLNSSGKIVRGI